MEHRNYRTDIPAYNEIVSFQDWNWGSTNNPIKFLSELVHGSVSQRSSVVPDEKSSLSNSNGFDLTNPNLEITIPNIPFLCRSEHYSKKAQNFIVKCETKEIEGIIESVSPYLVELMSDPYGRWMCQTLFDCCSSEQRLALLNIIKSDIISISSDERGTRTMQHIIRLATSPEEENIWKEAFQSHVLRLSTINNSAQVVNVLFNFFENRDSLISQIVGHARELACDRLGSGVIGRCLNDPQIFNELLREAIVLMQDKHGNGVLQIMIDNWQQECSLSIINCIKGKVVQLCIQKYSSNVIEKCLKEVKMRREIINELISGGRMQVLLESPYGCYVLRTAALELEKDRNGEFKRSIMAAIPQIRLKTFKPRWNEILSYLK